MSLNIVWLGDLGFPHGHASIRRAILVCKGLTECGINAMVLNRFGIHNTDEGLDIKREGVYEGINYIYASGNPYRPGNVFVRNYLKFRGMIGELAILFKLRRRGKLDAAILHTDKFLSILFYGMISKCLGFPLIMLYVELYSSIDTRQSIGHRINGYLYEKYGFYLLDGIIPISGYLMDFVKNRLPRLPMLKVPILADFNWFDGVERNSNEKYFIFCGGAAYLNVIVFIMNAFAAMEGTNELLYLVVNGSPAEMGKLDEEIAKNKKHELIKVYSGITNEDLSYLYLNACGLLIPLRPTIQDIARFPNKLGEYLASGNPVVTTSYGEAAKYLKDEESALIAEKYDIYYFAEKMQYIISNPEKAKEIGQVGRAIGLKNFSYTIYGPKIRDFINSVKMQNAVLRGTIICWIAFFACLPPSWFMHIKKLYL